MNVSRTVDIPYGIEHVRYFAGFVSLFDVFVNSFVFLVMQIRSMVRRSKLMVISSLTHFVNLSESSDKYPLKALSF